MCKWNILSYNNLPPIRDYWYLFASYDKKNDYFTFEKLHYSLDGCINGHNIKRTLELGFTYWMLPEKPKN